MAAKKINASFVTLGAFWPPDQPNECLVGTLSSRNGRVHYLTAPKYEVLERADFGQIFMQMGTVQRRNSISCLQGRTEEGNSSLFGLTEVETPGVVDTRSGENLYSTKFRVWAAVLGLRLAGPDTKEIESAVFRFTNIHEWMPRAWGVEFSDYEIAYRIPRKAYEVFSFPSLHLNAEVCCEVQASGRSKTKGKTSLVPVPVIRITPREPQSFEWFLDLLPRLENFFSLMLGTSVAPKQIGLLMGKDTGWLIKHQRRRQQKPNVQLWVQCEPHVVARALANWLAVPEDDQAIERTLLGTLRKSSLFVETEFLGLAQALEAFGRLHFNQPLVSPSDFKTGLKQVKDCIRGVWGKTPIADRCSQLLCHANETSFADRLRRTYALLPPAFLERYFGAPDDLTRTIVQTRNYFTHLGTSPGALVVRDGKELFLLNQKLTALLRCVMLTDLGIPFEHLDQAIAYQSKRWS